MLAVSIALVTKTEDCVLRRWANDFEIGPESLGQTGRNSRAVVGRVGKKPGYTALDPGDETRHRGFVTDMVGGQQADDDLATNRIIAIVQFAPGFTGLSGAMLLFLLGSGPIDFRRLA